MRTLLLGLIASLASAEYQPRNTQKPGEEPPTPAEAAAAMVVPEGFSVTLFAGEPDVRQPVAMALDSRGRLWVAESYSYKDWKKKGEDRILIFEDTDNDGRHDKRTVFWTGANHLSGMTVGFGGVWICDSPNLIFIPDRDHDDVPDGDPEVVLDGWTTKAGHNFFNGLTWGIDGWLYGRHGITAPSKVGVPGATDEDRVEFDCSLWRYHPVSKDFEVVCRGTTNPWGMDWNERGDLFFTNNVNGHLWHAIPGAYYPRMGNRHDPFSSHVYSRIGMCCDHLHHAGSTTDWSKTRDGEGVHGELGGGHSHCGGMIYLGGKWPKRYVGRMFMCNVHGRRVNVDRLDPEASGYVARHEPDLLAAGQPWFRGVQLLYGPDGDVFLSDWTDLGECHDNDGVHRTSGRIYKIIYGDPSPPLGGDLRASTDPELAAMQSHPNEWHARTARRLLQERAANGELTNPVQCYALLRGLLDDQSLATSLRVRALLTLHALELLSPSSLEQLVHDPDETLRAWAPRLATEPSYLDNDELGLVFKPDDPSPAVRLAWASLLSKAQGASRWQIAGDLARRDDVAGDPNLPHMIWYGIKDLVAGDPDAAFVFLSDCQVPLLRGHLSQRLAETGQIDRLLSTLEKTDSPGARYQIASGLLRGLGKKAEKSEAWIARRNSIRLDPAHRGELDWLLDRTAETRRLLDSLTRDSASADQRNKAIDRLSEARDRSALPGIIAALDSPENSPAAISALARYPSRKAADALASAYPKLDSALQPKLILALCASPTHAARLLEALAKGTIPRNAVTAYHARQIQGMKDSSLVKRLEKVWGRLGSTDREKRDRIRGWQNQLLPDVLAQADLANGKAKFQQLCATCHQLGGEGSKIGPDLTGANRSDLYYLLENVIAPSATLPRDYRLTTLTRKDGSVIAGNVAGKNEYSVTIQTLTEKTIVPNDEIAELETSEVSLMPEGLLEALTADEVRDLIAYLQDA